MLDIIINFLKSLFIKDKEEPSILHDVSIEALHNLSVTGDDVAKALGHMDEDGEFITEVQQEKQEMSKFDEIIEGVLKHEGGYVNDPTDLGGETNFGITKRFYPDVDIKNLTKEGAKEIYKKDYWDKNKVDEMPDNLKHIYFDMCVNFGRSGAVKVLQRASNAKNKEKIKVDGGIGPATLNAIQNLEIERVRAYRVLRFADIVIKKPEQERFWFGWFKRAVKV